MQALRVLEVGPRAYPLIPDSARLSMNYFIESLALSGIKG